MRNLRAHSPVAELVDRLDGIGRQIRNRNWGRFAAGVAATVGVLLLMVACQVWPVRSMPGALVALPVAGLLVAGVARWCWKSPATIDVARLVEAEFPQLDARLLTALQGISEAGAPHPLRAMVLGDVVEAMSTLSWGNAALRVVPRLQQWGRGSAVLLASAWLLAAWRLSTLPAAATQQLNGEVAARTEMHRWSVVVEPGDVELEQGTPLLVTARFEHAVPSTAKLVVAQAEREPLPIELAKNLGDAVFAGRLDLVDRDARYWIEYADQRSPEFKVRVFELPAVATSELRIDSPTYTGLDRRVLPNVSEASVLEGSTVQLRVSSLQAVERAWLENRQGEVIELQLHEHEWTATWNPATTTEWTMGLRDGYGRENRDRPTLKLVVTPNLPPEVAIRFPGRDAEVTPLAELQVEATAVDDYGILEYGILASPAGRATATPVVLGHNRGGGEKVAFENLFELETMGVVAGDLVTVYAYADDLGPAGQRRRTVSDVFFVEVRPFELRYATSRSEGESASPSEVASLEKLIGQQRQVVSASWNTLRKAEAVDFGDQRAEDTHEIATAEQDILSKFEQIAAGLDQVEQRLAAGQASTAMAQAVQYLERAIEERSAVVLQLALSPEQQAYAAMMKLRSSMRLINQSQGGQGQQAQDEKLADQQLNSLELKNDQNRYEQERRGAPQTDAQQQLAMLERLKDLARRQEAIAERLQELQQSAATANDDDARRREDQLRRLQDEQRQLLQDLDAAQTRLAQQSPVESRQQTQEKLDAARQQAATTEAALARNDTDQAAAEATRTQEQLKALQEEFRQRSAAGLTDAARSLRDASRELTQQQQQLQQQLAEERLPSATERPSLTDNTTHDARQDAIADQQQRLQQVLEGAKALVTAAEKAEPLMADRLYDVLRDARAAQPERGLQAAQQLQSLGRTAEASRAAESATTGIEELQRGIEQATQTVLGDDVESLKRARQEVTDLLEQLRQGQSGDSSTPGGSPMAAAPASDAKTGRGAPATEPTQMASSVGAASQPGQGSPSSENRPGNSPDGQGAKAQGAQPGEGAGAEPGAPSGPPGSGKSPGGAGGAGGPGSQESRRSWSQDSGEFNEKLHDLEVMLPTEALQAKASTIREQVRRIRAEAKRHSEVPAWDVVENSVYRPLVELDRLLANELLRRERPEDATPTDRDVAPARYRELLREYHERLGQSESLK